MNVGGVTLKLGEVRRVFTDAGFTAVRTILASGNVVFDSPEAVGAVRAEAEKALRDAFGYDAWVLADDLGTVAAVAEAYPFDGKVEGRHSYVTFVSDADHAEPPHPGQSLR